MNRRCLPLCLAVVLLAACAPDPSADVADTSWQVTDIWTTPGDPSSLPPQAAGRAWLAFGEQSLSGNTGCVPVQGTVSFTADGEAARADEADSLRIDRLEVESAAADCPAVWAHQHLTDLLEPGAEFDVHREERSLTLTLRSDAVDPPAIGLAAE